MSERSTGNLLGAIGQKIKNPVHLTAFVISVAFAFLLQNMFPGLPPLRKIDIGLIFIGTFAIIEIIWWFLARIGRLAARILRALKSTKGRPRNG